jgi:hypothetical protein
MVFSPNVPESKPNLGMYGPNDPAPKRQPDEVVLHSNQGPKPSDDNDNASDPESKHEPYLELHQLLHAAGPEEPQ